MITENSEDTFDLGYFFEVSPDLMCIAGYDGYFKKINPAVSKTLGYSYEELYASPINTFIHPEDQKITSEKRRNIKHNEPLTNFENRYITKAGKVVRLSWTSVPLKKGKMIFAIAKNLRNKKRLTLSDRHFQAENTGINDIKIAATYARFHQFGDTLSPVDRFWLNEFETVIRKHIGKINVNITLISDEMAISERQLFRRVRGTIGMTPNNFINIVRIKIALEAMALGKYSTLSEISNIAGFSTPAYFSKLFKEVSSENILDLLYVKKKPKIMEHLSS